MASYGFNFRATSGYVTDSAGETYVIGAVYPETRNGITFGWNTDISGECRDRATGIDVRLAGINRQTNDGTQKTFRIDLPAAGDYDIRLALGDGGGFDQAYVYLQVLDNATPVATIDDTDGLTAGGGVNFDDATGAGMTTAAWPGSNTKITKTFSSTTLNIKIGSPSVQTNTSPLAHFFIDAVGGAAPSASTFMQDDLFPKPFLRTPLTAGRLK